MKAASKIRDSAEIQRAKRERGESETRANAEIWEKAEKTRKAREANAKAENVTAERAIAWGEAKAKENA